MSFRRSSRNQNFTVVYNEVAQHDTMTMEARGLLLFMLSLPEDWEYHKKWLQDQCPGWGREKLAKILKELEQKGYLIRTTKRSEDGKKLAGWLWEVLAESGLETEERETRQSDKGVRQNSTKPERRVSRHSENQSDCPVAPTNKTSKQNKKSSESVKPAAPEINFSDRVFSELSVDGLTELSPEHIRYCQMKITEYQERFPQSQSVADCWSYVVKALDHRKALLNI